MTKYYYSSNSIDNCLGYSPATLRNTRHTDTLADVGSLGYKKMGKFIRCDKDVLDDWLAQFNTQQG